MDGQYDYMDRDHYFGMYNVYKHMETADADLLERMRDMVEDSVEFESLFTVPQPDLSKSYAVYTGHYNTRTNDHFFGRYHDPSYETVIDEFPMAARRWLVARAGVGDAKYYPRVVNTVDWAKDLIELHWDLYEDYCEITYPKNQYWGSYQIWTTYEAFQNGATEPCNLPCEEEDGWIRENNDGVVALKHKGLYLLSFYSNNANSSQVSDRSYLGGAPTILSSEGTGSVISSALHASAKPTSASQVASSCIYGKETDGTFFVSGKDEKKNNYNLTWIEQNKSFVIAREEKGKTVSWQYDLTDTGINITAGLAGSGVSGEYWINLPVYAGDKGNASSITLVDNTLTCHTYDFVLRPHPSSECFSFPAEMPVWDLNNRRK